MRGSRVQAVSNELNGERVDIVLWSDNAGAVRHQRDGAGGSAVDHRRRGKHFRWTSQSPKARPRPSARAAERASGQPPVRLAAERDDRRPGAGQETRPSRPPRQPVHGQAGKVDEESPASWWPRASTVEEIAYVPVGELLAVEGFDEDIVEECATAPATPSERGAGGRGGTGRTPAGRRPADARGHGRATPPTRLPNAASARSRPGRWPPTKSPTSARRTKRAPPP